MLSLCAVQIFKRWTKNSYCKYHYTAFSRNEDKAKDFRFVFNSLDGVSWRGKVRVRGVWWEHHGDGGGGGGEVRGVRALSGGAPVFWLIRGRAPTITLLSLWTFWHNTVLHHYTTTWIKWEIIKGQQIQMTLPQVKAEWMSSWPMKRSYWGHIAIPDKRHKLSQTTILVTSCVLSPMINKIQSLKVTWQLCT